MAKKRGSRNKKVKARHLEAKSLSYAKKKRFLLRNLIAFAILAVFSFIFFLYSEVDLYVNFFRLLSILFSFLVLALVIVFLLLFLMRNMKK